MEGGVDEAGAVAPLTGEQTSRCLFCTKDCKSATYYLLRTWKLSTTNSRGLSPVSRVTQATVVQARMLAC